MQRRWRRRWRPSTGSLLHCGRVLRVRAKAIRSDINWWGREGGGAGGESSRNLHKVEYFNKMLDVICNMLRVFQDSVKDSMDFSWVSLDKFAHLDLGRWSHYSWGIPPISIQLEEKCVKICSLVGGLCGFGWVPQGQSQTVQHCFGSMPQKRHLHRMMLRCLSLTHLTRLLWISFASVGARKTQSKCKINSTQYLIQ